MKKRLLSILVTIIGALNIYAQEWSATLSTKDGLPGEEYYYTTMQYYQYSSPIFTPDTLVDKIRITVIETRGNDSNNGNLYFALSELSVYDSEGNKISYEASSNAEHNAWASAPDGYGLSALNDDDIKSYFHSYWGNSNIGESHYIELSLKETVKTFKLEWTTRLDYAWLSPTVVGITLGTKYTTPEINFSLGDAVTSTDEFTDEKQFFALKGNAVDYYSYPKDSIVYSGNGELYMQNAESGDKEPSAMHSMQLLPVGNGKYFVYFPKSRSFLQDMRTEYKDPYGWQRSTSNIEEAAQITFTAVGNGNFEMQYDINYNGNVLTLYIGADPRQTSPLMQVFDLTHKNYLEEGNYDKGFSLPIAFNWNIYKVDVDVSAIEENVLSMATVAQNYLNSTISKAYSYLGKYGYFDNYDGYMEYFTLQRAAVNAEELTYSYNVTYQQILDAESNILTALSHYMLVKFSSYKKEVEEIQRTATYSKPPYIKGTYPESSESILEAILSTITNAESNPEAYSAEWYEDMYTQIENDIERFHETLITDDETSSGNGDTSIEENEYEIIEDEYIYLYLTNGGVEAYSLAALDGNYYTSDGKIYFPLKGDEVEYYTAEEYDSCSTIAPAMPTLSSFKFNNKYNPNLHVDAEAEEINNDIHFSLNSIGKWLTPSFNLSDEEAIAYVNNVPQESKVSRQDFSSPVTYHVCNPKHYRTERVKTIQQTSNGNTDSSDYEVKEIPLTGEMLSTNKPSQNPKEEGLENLLDNNPETIFHSTWGSANNATSNINTYITIALPYPVKNIQIYYRCRPQRNYNPKEWEIYASKNGSSWTLVRTLNYEKDNMPTGGVGQEYTSPTISLGDSYSYIKILQTAGEYSKNHFVLSELRLYEVISEETSTEVEEAYKNVRLPLGNKYNINIDWLADRVAGVPRIDINIDGGEFVEDKEKYLNANFIITGYGMYENFEDSVQIKGRGNTSWGYDKKPFRLKFEKKVKPFGLTKGKSWVLLANAQKGSLMANAISMKIGQMAGSQYTNHIVPVELYMNGSYMGSYMFTEKVGLANNSVDVDEDDGYLLELDTYVDDEIYGFETFYYSLPVNIKEPDLAEYDASVATARRDKIVKDMNELCGMIYNGEDVESRLDMDAFARFYLANDLSLNQEINHPKSTFLFKEDEDSYSSKIKFGPIWDFDWGYGYQQSSGYCKEGSTSSLINNLSNSSSKTSLGYKFFKKITESQSFKKHYYKVWKEFLNNNSIDELIDYIDNYYNFASSSFQNNKYNEQGNRYGFTSTDRDRHKSWVKERAEYIYANIDKVDIGDLIYTMKGDANCNNTLTIHDVALTLAYLNGIDVETFSAANADCNGDGDGEVNMQDISAMTELVMKSKAPSALYWNSTPLSLGEWYAPETTFEIDNSITLGLELNSEMQDKYNALQFDVIVPGGIYIDEIKCGDDITTTHNFINERKSGDTYRVIIYSDQCETFNSGTDQIAQLTFVCTSVIEEVDRHIDVKNTYVIDERNNELRIDDYSIRFGQTTSVKEIAEEILVKGGDYVSITTLAPKEVAIYSVDGRKVQSINCKNGTTRIDLPSGVYIVNGNKITVK